MMGASLRFLKYLKIWLTSFSNFVEIEEGSFSMLVGTNLILLELLPLVIGFTLGVNFDNTFCLNIFKLLSVYNKFQFD